MRVHRRIRTGCTPCKRRKVKCDETKPSCANCLRNGLNCSLSFLIPTSRPLRPPAPRAPSAMRLSISPTLYLQPKSQTYQASEVFHHYHHHMSFTCLILGPTRTVHVWQESISAMAVSSPFLMHGLLAVSALHLASLQPVRKAELLTFATSCEQQALPSFRHMLPAVPPTDVDAAFAFSTLVVPYIIATGTGDARIPRLDDDRPHWFLAIRGLLALLATNWVALTRGAFGPLLACRVLPGSYGAHPEDETLARICALLEPTTASSRRDERELGECRQALEQLRRIWALLLSPCGFFAVQNVIYIWPGVVSQGYIQLLHNRRPEALVVLAHFCVLLKRVHSTWYWKGIGLGLMGAICDELSPVWTPWIQWAVDQPVSGNGGESY